MKLPPLQPMSHNQICVSGNVTIHPSAVIAPDVLLQAEPGSCIVISAGVCIGMGTILHSSQGPLEVGESANIGTGVLFVGSGKIGTKACVGSSTTLLNANVQAEQVIPAGSILGDTSRQANGHAPPQPGLEDNPKPASNREKEPEPTAVSPTSTLSSEEPINTSTVNQDQTSVEEPSGHVYGRAYVNQLLVKLMPHKQQLN